MAVVATEDRYKMLAAAYPDEAQRLVTLAQADVDTRWQSYANLATKGVSDAVVRGGNPR